MACLHDVNMAGSACLSKAGPMRTVNYVGTPMLSLGQATPRAAQVVSLIPRVLDVAGAFQERLPYY